MDIDDFRSILESSGVDVWTFIETAITVASLDFASQLKHNRDNIVELLYSSSSARCTNCDFNQIKHTDNLIEVHKPGTTTRSPSTTPRSIHGDEEDEEEDDDDDVDPYAGLFDDEQKKVLDIKQQLENNLDQHEDYLVELLQTLADMDITFKTLKETDIGRHVNDLRKHSSNEVRRLVKHLVRKWKEIVDEWVRLNPQRENASFALMADGDSPQQKIPQNGHHQVPDFAYSPHNGSSGSDKNNSEPEHKPKPVPRRVAPPKPIQQSIPASTSHNAQRQREQQKESNFDSDKLASARKRLQANYKEAENAKKQRTIQVMDIHELPKPKNKSTFFPRNKGGGSQGHGGRHW